MPPKKTSVKKAPRPLSPSGRGCGPAEQEQAHDGPAPRKIDDDQDISFEKEEAVHDDKANHEKAKGDEEHDQLTDGNANDQTYLQDQQLDKKNKETAIGNIQVQVHLQQPGFGLKNNEPKTQNKTVKESNSGDEEISFEKTQDSGTYDEGPKHGMSESLSTMNPGQLEDSKEPGREYKSVPTVPSQEESVRRNDSLMAYGINIGIPKNALAILTDDRREEAMELIVECTRTLLVESTGQGPAQPSRGNPATVADTNPNGAAEDRLDIKKDKDVSVSDAGKHLYAHQQNAVGPVFVEEVNGGGSCLITNDNGDPVSLRGNAWRALSSYGKAYLQTMRKHHNKRTGPNGGSKSNEKGYKTNARQRAKITGEPEESALKP